MERINTLYKLKYSITILLLLIFLIIGSALSQAETNLWYFGERAGLDFGKRNPVAVNNGKMSAMEGCAVASDSDGKLLFYSNGIEIWNKNHEFMDGYDYLLGSENSTQAALIIPFPGKSEQYFLFTSTDPKDSNLIAKGVFYFIVDMEQNNGLGKVILKNGFVLGDATEKLTAVEHSNGTDYWVIGCKSNTNSYHAFLIDENGFNLIPVISNSGSIQNSGSNGYDGYLKASPNGEFIASANFAPGIVDLFQFDRSSGKMQLYTSVEDDRLIGAYGIEFSPNNSLLYITTFNSSSYVFQFDITDPNNVLSTIIGNSAELKFGALQLGPDGKIYVAINNHDYLGVINKPDTPGTQCEFIENGVNLAGRICKLGLPNYLSGYFDQSSGCDETSFYYQNFINYSNLELVGASKVISDFLRLNPAEVNKSGAVWHNRQVPLKNGFITTFDFMLSEGQDKDEDGSYPGGDGIAFVIQNTSTNVMGAGGAGLSYSGIFNSIAIEFDTYMNTLPIYKDINDLSGSHISVQTNRHGKNSSQHSGSYTLGYAESPVDLKADGTIYNCKIEYDSKDQSLEIFIGIDENFDEPALVIESFIIEEIINLDDSQGAFVGFTAATGSSFEAHDLLSWYFCPGPSFYISSITKSTAQRNIIKCSPNPVVDYTNIEFEIIDPDWIKIGIYDILGISVDEIFDGYLVQGSYSIEWKRKDNQNGLYFIHFYSSRFSSFHRLILN